jgi:hypothetical protein
MRHALFKLGVVDSVTTRATLLVLLFRKPQHFVQTERELPQMRPLL